MLWDNGRAELTATKALHRCGELLKALSGKHEGWASPMTAAKAPSLRMFDSRDVMYC